jgi:hypothetical protein
MNNIKQSTMSTMYNSYRNSFNNNLSDDWGWYVDCENMKSVYNKIPPREFINIKDDNDNESTAAIILEISMPVLFLFSLIYIMYKI